MLSDFLHAVLHSYIDNLDTEQANSLLASFVNENTSFFRTDPDVNVTFSDNKLELFTVSRSTCIVRKRKWDNFFPEHVRRQKERRNV